MIYEDDTALQRYNRKYYADHRSTALKRAKENARTSEEEREYRKELRIKALESLGKSICRHCGNDDRRTLQIDHIRGGGTKEKPYTRTSAFLTEMAKTPNKKFYQVLCANCNWIKRHENNETTRQT